MESHLLVQLLQAINHAQSAFLATFDFHRAFDQLLQDVLDLTDSEYGFIGEVHYNQQGAPYLKTHAITDIAWDDASRDFYAEHAATGFEFTNLKSLFGAALTTMEPVIANNAATDPRRGGIPPGHPPLHTFLGLPFKRGKHLVGMVGLANRPDGYDQELITFLEPLLATITQLIDARHTELARQETQRLLRDSEHRLKLATASADLGIWDLDLESGWLEWNSVMFRLYGINPEEFCHTAAAWQNALHPDDRERAEREIALAIDKQREFNTEFRIVRADGDIRHIRAMSRVVCDDHHKVCRIIGINMDITKQKQAEQHLRESDKRFRDVAAAAGEYIWETDAEGIYRFLTRPIEDILGQPVEKLLGHTPFEFMPEDEQQRVGEFFRNAASRQETFRGLEHCSRHSNGQIVWQLVSGLPTFDAMGELQGYRGVAMDISRQKLTEASLEAYAKSTQAILDNVVDGIITIDSLGYVKSFNLAAERIFGYQATEVLSQKINMLMPEPHSLEHDNYLLAYQRTGNARIIGIGREVEGKHKDGHLFPMELSISEVVQNGEVTYIGMARDITERKRIERMKNEFVSTVSHELRTPLTSISGSLGLIAGGATGELNPQTRQLVAVAYKNSQRLGHLINDLLDMEKIAAGKMRFDMVMQELMPIVEQALEANQAYARQYDVTCQLVERAEDMLVRVDAQRLEQVLSNLLSNAAKFSPTGETVEVAIGAQRDKVRIEIRDRGPGISREFRSRLFTKFSQADSSDARQKGGTGLGLAISKELVERMGGTIGVNSELGQGSVFYFELPAVHRDDLGEKPSAATESDGSTPRILVVEDDPDVAHLLAGILQQDGYHTDIAYSGAQAIALVEQMTYVAMTLDLRLPDRNGISIIRQLRTNSITAHIPIVVVAGNVEEGQLALKGGFSAIDWLQKPIDQQTLLESIRRAAGAGDDNPLVLHIEDDEDIRSIISLVGQDVAIFHAASTMLQARQQLEENIYDVVILDIGLPDGSGWDLLPLIKQQTRIPQIIVLSGHELNSEQMAQVDQVLLKAPTSVQELIEILRKIPKGDTP